MCLHHKLGSPQAKTNSIIYVNNILTIFLFMLWIIMLVFTHRAPDLAFNWEYVPFKNI